MGPKTEKDLFLKVSREKSITVSREVSRERSVLEGHMDEEGQKRLPTTKSLSQETYDSNRSESCSKNIAFV